MKPFRLLLSILFPLTSLLPFAVAAAQEAQEDPLAGHSYHGEAFNEGPRQRAVLIPGTGDVHFEITTSQPEAQTFFDQGVGQLHGFWYLEAERSFRQAAMIDPDAAMPYWGMARANVGNEKRAKGFLKEALKRKQQASPREQRYIDALNEYYNGKERDRRKRNQNYAKALERLIYDYPDDVEAKAFLGLQLYVNKGKGIPIQSYLAVDALLHDVLEQNPMHPCHHYLIHLWDYEKPEKALPSAARCGQSAPAIAHMWHMPGHIYSRLHRYQDAAWQQEASARVDHAHMIKYGLLPDEIHNFAHNNEWLIRNLINVGRAGDAVALAKNMIELPRHPKYNTLSRGSAHYGRIRLFDALEAFEAWRDLVDLCSTRYLEPTDNDVEQIRRMRYLGEAFYRIGEAGAGDELLLQLRDRLDAVEDERRAAAVEAMQEAREKGQSDKQIQAAAKRAGSRFNARLTAARHAVENLKGYSALLDGDGATALVAFQHAGRVPAVAKAEAHRLMGEVDDAVELLTKDVHAHPGETIPLANAAWYLWEAGRKDDAMKTFAQLREISGSLDLSAQPFARLAPLAAEAKLPEDWRSEFKHPPDFGDRPELDSLGPFRWTPPLAPGFALRNADGKEVKFEDYRGKPVCVIFYLGFGCLHCAQQLQAFAPRTEDFRRAGIELLAVSTDSPGDLTRSAENYEGGFPFPLVSDHGLEVFKRYRVYDDFESQPLHGTFLIDAEGRIQWKDISYEPFSDPQFVLDEARRLLYIDELPPERETASTPVP